MAIELVEFERVGEEGRAGAGEGSGRAGVEGARGVRAGKGERGAMPEVGVGIGVAWVDREMDVGKGMPGLEAEASGM